MHAWLLDGDPSIRWQVLAHLDHAPAEIVDAERRRVATEGWGAAARRPGPRRRLGRRPLQPQVDLDHLHPAPAPLARPPSGHPAALAGCRRLWDGATYSTAASTWPGPSANPRPASPPCSCSSPAPSASTIPGSTTRWSGPSASSPPTGLELRDGPLRLPARLVPHHHLHPRRPPPLRDRRRGPPGRRRRPAGPVVLLRPPALPLPPHRCRREPRVHAVPVPAAMALRHRARPRALPGRRRSTRPRLADAIDVVRRAARRDGTWPLQRGHPGRTWFRLEEPGPSRWATLRARRAVLVDDSTEI